MSVRIEALEEIFDVEGVNWSILVQLEHCVTSFQGGYTLFCGKLCLDHHLLVERVIVFEVKGCNFYRLDNFSKTCVQSQCEKHEF